MPKLPNQASFILDGQKDNGEDKISLPDRQIDFVHAQMDNPSGEFDLIVEDMAGNEQLVRRGLKNKTGRWGERISLPVNDNYCRVKVENVKGTKRIDLFFE